MSDRERETLLLAAFAALPLYVTQAISPMSVFTFHAGLLLAAVIQLRGWSIDSIALVARIAAIAYLPFFFIDALVISRSLIRSSVHLLFFIALYQAFEPVARKATLQRFLVIFLIFITGLATSTHVTVLAWVIAFGILAFGQMMRWSRDASVESLQEEPDETKEAPVLKAAVAFASVSALVAIALFPTLPRMKSPFVRGMSHDFSAANTGISETIDFTQMRHISSDPAAVARVWMPQDAIPFFTPLRLRVSVYDEWKEGKWVAIQGSQTDRITASTRVIRIANPGGYARGAQVEQKAVAGTRLFLPQGTYAVTGIEAIDTLDVYGMARIAPGSSLARENEFTYGVSMSRETRPLLARPAAVPDYPVTPAVRDLARQIAGGETDPLRKAAAIERWMLAEFDYVANPANLGRTMSIEEFLLEVRRGHCEYFAAGMVVLLTALDVPSRIVGGFYGGELNPLIGSFVVRQRDAHAWVEIYEDGRWHTYDPTPPDLRPGSASQGLLRAYLSALRDSAAYFWDRYILTFGSEDQIAMIIRAIIRVRSAWRSAMGQIDASLRMASEGWIIAILIFPGLFAAILLLWRRKASSLYDRLLRRLERFEIRIAPSTTPGEVLDAVRERRPDLAHLVEPVVEAHLRERFSPAPPPPALLDRARLALRELAKQA